MSQKNLTLATLGLVALSSASLGQDLVISEIVDGTLPGGLPKWVELTNNSAATVDLSNFTIGNMNNGGTTLGGGMSLALFGMLAPGESYVLSYEDGDMPGLGVFFDVYGCDPDNFDQGAFFNGDDVIILFNADGSGPNGEANGDGSDATIHDIYGEIGVDGTGTAWEYIDSYANRIGTAASATFNAADWNIPGPDSLEDPGGDDTIEEMNLQNNTDPGSCTPPPAGFVDSCNGDGGDGMGCTPCPCGNDAMANTIGGCLNSALTSGRLIGSGTDSVSAGDLRFEGQGMTPNSFAVLTSGDAIAPANAANPCFGLDSGVQSAVLDGLRCAVQNTQRHGGRPVGADGTVGMGLTNGWGPPNGPMGGLPAQGGFVAGQTRHYQVFYRELPGTSCGTEQNTSQAVTVNFSM